MPKLADIVRTPESSLDPEMIRQCKLVDAKRARAMIDHILQHGIVTNDELRDIYRYEQPPRAARDVREAGIPLITHRLKSEKTGRQMGAYTFDDISKIRSGRLGGRVSFSKQFKAQLVQAYGARDTITRAWLDERYLQIDHRIPYEVAGDGGSELAVEDFMLLDASSNRAKSWSCEHCDNWLVKHEPDICKTCFWASPEDYQHVAETPSRRVEITWTGDETTVFDRLKSEAAAAGLDLAAFIKKRLGE